MPQLAPIADPLELATLLGADAATQTAVSFAFAWRDVPFSAAIAAEGDGAVLRLRGAVGPMPFTIESAQRRQCALRTLAEAACGTGLGWRVTPAHEILIEGEARLSRPVSPAAMIAGAVSLLSRADGYLALLLDVLGEAACLTLPAAA